MLKSYLRAYYSNFRCVYLNEFEPSFNSGKKGALVKSTHGGTNRT